jgi:hypothetical protein
MQLNMIHASTTATSTTTTSIDTPAAAAYIGFSAKTLRAWRCKGKGPVYKKHGTSAQARVRYTIADLNAYLAQNQVSHTVRAHAA